MAIAPVGSAATFDSGSSNITSTSGQSVSITPTAGNCLVAFVFMRGSTSSTVSGASTGGTATFTPQLAQLGNSTYLHILTAPNVGSGITAVTFTPNVSARGDIWVQEYSGVDNTTPMDVAAAGGALSNSSTLSPASVNPATSGAVVLSGWGASANFGSSSPYPAASAGPTAHSGTKAGVGWTSEYNKWSSVGTNHGMVVGSNVVDDITGAYQADWTPVLSAAAVGGTIVLRPASVASYDDAARAFFRLF